MSRRCGATACANNSLIGWISSTVRRGSTLRTAAFTSLAPWPGEMICAEGRYVEADFGRFTAVSIYLPSGSSGPERQAIKFKFLDYFFPHLKNLAAEGRDPALVFLGGIVGVPWQDLASDVDANDRARRRV